MDDVLAPRSHLAWELAGVLFHFEMKWPLLIGCHCKSAISYSFFLFVRSPYYYYLLSQAKKASHRRERVRQWTMPWMQQTTTEWTKDGNPAQNKEVLAHKERNMFVVFNMKKAFDDEMWQEAVNRKLRDVTRRPHFLTSSSRSPAFRRPSWMAAPRGRIFFTYMGAELPIGTSLEVILKPNPSGPIEKK